MADGLSDSDPAPSSSPIAANEEAASAEVEAERRRLRRWFWALGILTVVGIFGLVRYNYPVVTTSRGTSYQITFRGRYRGTDGSWAEFDYLTHGKSIDEKLGEVHELLPLATELADSQGDSLVRIVAVDRRFQFGLFSLDRRVIVQFYRVGNEWRML